MKRHRFDPVSFVFGGAFMALAAVALSGHVGVTALRLRWLGVGFLLALGVALLITSSQRARR